MAFPLNDSDNLNGFKIFGSFKLWQTKIFGQKSFGHGLMLNVYNKQRNEISWFPNRISGRDVDWGLIDNMDGQW